jgi:hypothetical protein
MGLISLVSLIYLTATVFATQMCFRCFVCLCQIPQSCIILAALEVRQACKCKILNRDVTSAQFVNAACHFGKYILLPNNTGIEILSNCDWEIVATAFLVSVLLHGCSKWYLGCSQRCFIDFDYFCYVWLFVILLVLIVPFKVYSALLLGVQKHWGERAASHGCHIFY